MTKGSKCLHVRNKYRTLSWLLTVAGRLVVHTSPPPRLASEDNPFRGGVQGQAASHDIISPSLGDILQRVQLWRGYEEISVYL